MVLAQMGKETSPDLSVSPGFGVYLVCCVEDAEALA